MSGIPQTWTDDGTTLTCPSSVPGGPTTPIRGRMRDYVLANAWPYANVALSEAVHKDQLELSNSGLGPGWVQEFRWARLEIPDTGPHAGQVIWGWLGTELHHIEALYAQALAEIAQLKAQPAGLDPNAVATRLTALALLFHQAGQAATQGEALATQAIA